MEGTDESIELWPHPNISFSIEMERERWKSKK